jgi:hypothetical protein
MTGINLFQVYLDFGQNGVFAYMWRLASLETTTCGVKIGFVQSPSILKLGIVSSKSDCFAEEPSRIVRDFE